MKHYFFLLGLIFILLASHPSVAKGIYLVKGVKVSVSATNEKKAKQEAIDKAQIDAFKELVLKADLPAEFFIQNNEDILSSAREYQVSSESISKSNYSGV